MTRRLLGLLLALLCCAQSAAASWFPGLSGLQSQQRAGEALVLHMTAQLDRAQDVSDLSMQALAALLPRTALRLVIQAQEGSEYADAQLAVDNTPLLGLTQHQRQDVAWAVVNGRAYTAAAGTDPLGWLGDADAISMPPLPGQHWAQVLSGDLKELWEPFADDGVPETRSRTLTGTGTARRQVRYKPAEEAWAAAWPQTAATLADALLAPGSARTKLLAWLQTLQFQGPVDLRLYTARDEVPMGWQFTGTVLAPGYSPRKVTLLLTRAQDKGLHVNLRAKALEGADDLSVRVTLQESRGKDRGTLRGDAVWNWRAGKLRDSGSARLSLSARDTRAGVTLKGTLSVDLPARGSRPRRVTRLTPDLLLQDGVLSGTARLTQKEAGRDALDMTLALRMASEPFAQSPAPLNALNADSMDAAALQRETEALQTALLEPLTALLLGLPQNQRLALIHDMGRTARTAGESTPPLYNYQVAPDTDNEEDTP